MNPLNEYVPAVQQWSAIDPNLSGRFVNNKVIHLHLTLEANSLQLTQTEGGAQILETQSMNRAGFGGKLSNLFHRAEDRFGGTPNSRWALFGINENLLAEFTAKTSYGAATALKGWIFLAENHFGWVSHIDSQNRVVKTLIPWVNVTDIIPTSRHGPSKKYQFRPITEPGSAQPEGFQLLTRDNLVYQFFGLKSNIEQVFQLLNNVWLGRHTIPGFVSGLQIGGFNLGPHNVQGYGLAAQAPQNTLNPNLQNTTAPHTASIQNPSYPPTMRSTAARGVPGGYAQTTLLPSTAAVVSQTSTMSSHIMPPSVSPVRVNQPTASVSQYDLANLVHRGLVQPVSTAPAAPAIVTTMGLQKGYAQSSTGAALGQTAPGVKFGL
ncbi:hypothetical protein PROFUN_03125 [Planoprotostelium fungivorum]|uniref:Uncharacterized protein n=1 Tax=Planoprotostelium fungivorum TaxID=1890364 RepID=A0A2P6NQF5_9EUKA|nr:hypothetical protein PROFUN_03125 [Planoprotostelium fungivorum]